MNTSSFTNRLGPLAAVMAAAVLALTGCGGPSESRPSGGSSLDAMADALNDQAEVDAQAAKDQAATAAQAAADAKAAAAARMADGNPTTVTTQDMQRGSGLTRGGYLQTVLKGGIRAEQKLNMATVTHALNLFWGLEGRYPKDHEEFMEKVIRANGIVLEPLQEPYEYLYNAEDHTVYKVVKQEAINAANAEAEAAQAEADAAAEAAKN